MGVVNAKPRSHQQGQMPGQVHIPSTGPWNTVAAANRPTQPAPYNWVARPQIHPREAIYKPEWALDTNGHRTCFEVPWWPK